MSGDLRGFGRVKGGPMPEYKFTVLHEDGVEDVIVSAPNVGIAGMEAEHQLHVDHLNPDEWAWRNTPDAPNEYVLLRKDK